MKTLLFFALAVVASSVNASPDETTGARRKGIDMLAADCVHDARGHVLVVLPDKTPFDSNADARRHYLDAYAAGFRSGYTGKLSLHDATSQALMPGELERWSAGQWTG